MGGSCSPTGSVIVNITLLSVVMLSLSSSKPVKYIAENAKFITVSLLRYTSGTPENVTIAVLPLLSESMAILA